MPDGIDLKRIINLDPETTVTDDDYTIVDSANGGAKKFALGQALNDLKSEITDIDSVVFKETENLIRFTVPSFTENGATVKFDNGHLTINGTASSAITKDGAFEIDGLTPNTSYAIRFFNVSGLGNSQAIYVRNGNSNLVSAPFGANGRNGVTFTTPSDISNITYRIYINSGTFSDASADIIITKGSTVPTEYIAPKVKDIITQNDLDNCVETITAEINRTDLALSWERGSINNGIDTTTATNIVNRIRTSKIVHVKAGSYVETLDNKGYLYISFYDGHSVKSFKNQYTFSLQAGRYTFSEDAYVRFLYFRQGDLAISPQDIGEYCQFRLYKADDSGVDIIFIGSIYNVLGDCSIIKFPSGKILMIDCWSYQDYYFPKYMTDYGITHIDYFILSHYHADHMGNFNWLVTNGFIDDDTTVYLPQALDTTQSGVTTDWADVIANYESVMSDLETAGSTTVIPDEGDVFCVDGYPIEFWNVDHSQYYPGGDYESTNYNDFSLCNYLVVGNTRIGFSGDLGWTGQEKCAGTMLKCNIYKAQHHGWDNDPNHLIPAYINRVVPDVVFSEDCSRHESYIDTKTSPMQSWCEANAVSNYRTAINGNMVAHVNEDGWSLGGSYARYIRNGKNWSFSDNSEHIET